MTGISIGTDANTGKTIYYDPSTGDKYLSTPWDEQLKQNPDLKPVSVSQPTLQDLQKQAADAQAYLTTNPNNSSAQNVLNSANNGLQNGYFSITPEQENYYQTQASNQGVDYINPTTRTALFQSGNNDQQVAKSIADSVKIESSTTPKSAVTQSNVSAPYDYKTDPTFLAWKKDYDGMNALNLEQANKTWQEKYGGLQTNFDELNKNYGGLKSNFDKTSSQLNEYMPYKDKASNLEKQLSTVQANYDDLNGRYTGLQKEQVKAINNQNGGSNQSVADGVNMQNYNDNRNATADQWWSKYLTGRR